jgi:FAD/FMN-containing dehydrogenase
LIFLTFGPTLQCSTLQTLFGVTKLLQKQTSAYEAFTNSYWSIQQASVDPSCIVKPANTIEVSVAVLLSRLTQCPFAVKSGGHAAFGGASSIPGGVTIALENLKDITLSADKKIVSVEPGNTWYDVYTALQDKNLAVIGGRVSSCCHVRIRKPTNFRSR